MTKQTPKPLTRIEYNKLIQTACPNQHSYPKDFRGALQELQDRGFDVETDTHDFIKFCHNLKLIPHAYCLYDNDIDAIATYCRKQKKFSKTLLGCQLLDLSFFHYKVAELRIRKMGYEPHNAVIVAPIRHKGGRQVFMVPDPSETKKRKKGY